MKITVMAPALTYALTAVIPHAATDGTIPAINSVGLQVRDGRLYVSATDRYTLGVAHLPTVEKSDAEFQAIIDQADARQLLQIVKLAQAEVGKLIESEITLSVEKDMLVVATMWKNHMLRLRRADQVSAALGWESFLPSFVDGATGDALTAFSPTYLARFVKAMPDKHATMITYQSSGTKPAFVAVGDSFFGFVMPVRIAFSRLEEVLPQAAGGTRPNTVTEEVEAKAMEVAMEGVTKAAIETELRNFAQSVADAVQEEGNGVTVTPGAPPKDEDAPDLSDKKPATVRPAKKAAPKKAVVPKTLSEKEWARDKAFYARQGAKAKKAPAKRTPRSAA